MTRELTDLDPEMTAVHERFVAGVALDAPLDPRARDLVRLAALIALGAQGEYRRSLMAALDDGVTPVEVKEVVYQAVPYVGYARVTDFADITNDVLTRAGVELPLPGQSTTTPETRAERGLAVQKQIVGGETVDTMYANAPADEQHVQRYLSAHCFGDHYTRDGLDVPTRELLTLAMLVALGGADPQVAGHVAANVRVGNDRATLIAVLTHLLPLVGYPRTLNALRALDDVAPAAQTSPEES